MATTNGSPNGTHGPIRKVLILGDNRLSSSILSGLASTDLELHQITHAHSTESSHPGLTIHKSDFSPASLSSLFKSIEPDLLFSTQSSGSFTFQKQLIDTAIQTHIPRFVAAEFGHDTLNPKIQDRLPPYKEKAKTIQYLQQQQQQKSSIEWLAIATGCHPLEHALVSGNLGFDLKWQSATIPSPGTQPFAASSSAWISRLSLALITHWPTIKNSYLYASGMLTTANALLQSLQDQMGQTWEVGNTDVGDLVDEADRRFERGFPDAGMFLMERSVLYDGDLEAVRPFVERDAEAKLGLGEGEDLGEVVERVVHEFEHLGGGGCGCE